MAIVELHFPLTGTTLPLDHGYALYGAISRHLPEVHGADWIAIESISGKLSAPGVIRLDSLAVLRVRLPEDRSSLLSGLEGRMLEIDRHQITIGSPRSFSLIGSPTLRAKIVTIKGFTEPGPFLHAVQRQLVAIGVLGIAAVGTRRVVRIGNHTIIGFDVTVGNLCENGSFILQELGIGGRRRMGGGVFFPAVE